MTDLQRIVSAICEHSFPEAAFQSRSFDAFYHSERDSISQHMGILADLLEDGKAEPFPRHGPWPENVIQRLRDWIQNPRSERILINPQTCLVVVLTSDEHPNAIFQGLPVPPAATEDEPMASAEAIHVAQQIASAFGHQWAQAYWRDTMETLSVSQLDWLTRITTNPGPMGYGITAPGITADGSVGDTTSTGRSTWEVSPDGGSVFLQISRPQGVVLTMTLDRDGHCSIQRVGKDIPLFDRHREAGIHLAQAAAKGLGLGQDQVRQMIDLLMNLSTLPEEELPFTQEREFPTYRRKYSNLFQIEDEQGQRVEVKSEQVAARAVQLMRRKELTILAAVRAARNEIEPLTHSEE